MNDYFIIPYVLINLLFFEICNDVIINELIFVIYPWTYWNALSSNKTNIHLLISNVIMFPLLLNVVVAYIAPYGVCTPSTLRHFGGTVPYLPRAVHVLLCDAVKMHTPHGR